MNDNRNLSSDAQRQAAEWVRDLPEELEPDLAWRAALNSRIRLEADRKAKRRLRWSIARPAFGLLTAASLAAVIFAPRPTPVVTPVGSRLEASLIALHNDSVATANAVGTGLRPSEAAPSLVAGNDSSDLTTEFDVGAF